MDKMKAANCQFYFSHDPMITLEKYSDSGFAMELNWLKESYGIKEFTKAHFVPTGDYWTFVPYP